MDIESGREHESRVDHPRYFLGDMKDGAFQQTRGYFVGFFMGDKALPDGTSLNILGRQDVECAVIELSRRDESRPHYHMLGYEITYCLSGRLRLIVDQTELVELVENQFLIIPPGTVLQNPENDPETRVFVVKVPSVPNDKYYAE